jgi:hypothetical protein
MLRYKLRTLLIVALVAWLWIVVSDLLVPLVKAWR